MAQFANLFRKRFEKAVFSHLDIKSCFADVTAADRSNFLETISFEASDTILLKSFDRSLRCCF